MAGWLWSRGCWAMAVTLICGVVTADERQSEETTAAVVRKMVGQACVDCHGDTQAEGELNLQQLPWKLDSAEQRAKWEHIHDRISKKEMPPVVTDLPDDEREQLLGVLADALHAADHAEVMRHGRGPMRRLNRLEFEANLRDLLQLPYLDIRDILPEDRESHHTNKSADTLDMTRVQLSAYLDASAAALRSAIASSNERRSPGHYQAFATKMFPKAVDHAGRESSFYAKDSKMIPLTSGDLAKLRKADSHDPEVEIAIFRSANWPYYGYPEEFIAGADGEYLVRFEARAVRQVRDFRLLPALAPQPMTFRARQPSLADVSGDVRATGGVIDIQPESNVYETMVQLKQGETIEYSLLGLPVPFPITSHGGPLYYDFPPMPEDGHPGIAYRWIEITGPIDSGPWPAISHQNLFGDMPIRESQGDDDRLPIEVISENPRRDAQVLLRRFAENASCRPPTSTALEIYLQLVQSLLDEGRSFTEAMLGGYQAWLCSTEFLYLREPVEDADHFAIASRLSHFLWNSRPDAALLAQAESRQLRQCNVLREETQRLISDRRFTRFVENFTDYWLDLREIGRDPPDTRLYPEYRGDDYLIESMERETREFFSIVVRENLPVASLVDCDFAMINDRLASHYELPGVSGSAIRKVTLPAWSPRGGLLSQAAILKVTANGTTTSPVLRGVWVIDRLLGDPPPPPPSDVPTIVPDLRGASTIREILQAHAADEACAECHRRFDPVGLAMENFDVLGGWRDRYRSLEKGDEITGVDRAGHAFKYHVANSVDSRGELADGRSFDDIQQLRVLLAVDARKLARNLLYRFTVYATGTPVRFSDRREIEKILDRCAPQKYRVGDLIQ